MACPLILDKQGKDMRWYNEPQMWAAPTNTIRFTTNPKTDFWRKTHSGAIADNGHFYYQTVAGNFTAEVKFSGQYRDLYDQAGLMLRHDESTWLKCGIEYVNEIYNASVVITHDFSDWSVTPLKENPAAMWLRLVWHQPTIEVYYSLDGAVYNMMRQAYLTTANELQVGVMACSPTGSGFEATFEHLKIEKIEKNEKA